jgi:hypothetical protein
MRASVFAFLMILAGLSAPAAGTAETSASQPTVYVTFWFDTEDYLLPASDDAAKRLAEIFDAQGVKATFKVVGEKARVLRDRGRGDVIDALKRHDIGYHTDFHSVHPTPSEYSRECDWDEGVAAFMSWEGRGLEDVKQIFGVARAACYGQPGSSWTPQSYAALRKMNIPVYLDDTSQVGLAGRPFWYGGVLNALNLEGYTTRADVKSEDGVRKGCEAFEKIRQRVLGDGGGLISIYYHPCEWVHEQFWDGVNFAKGANPPRGEWKQPPQKPAAATEEQFRNFAKYLEFVRTRPNVKLVTATEIAGLYPDAAYARPFPREEIGALARSIAKEVTFARLDGRTVSAAEALLAIAQFAADFAESGRMPDSIKADFAYGPSSAPDTIVREGNFAWPRFAQACRDYLRDVARLGRMPAVVWIEGKAVDPVDFAATLGAAVTQLIETGKPPDRVRLVRGNWTAAKYVADDSDRLWGWVIFPEDFRAPKMMHLARLQSWTIKPAVISSPGGKSPER